jgi:hypothetical protein
VHPEGSRFIACRRNDAPPMGLPTDSNGFSAECGVIALLNGRVERIHVDVKDAAHGQAGNFSRCFTRR